MNLLEYIDSIMKVVRSEDYDLNSGDWIYYLEEIKKMYKEEVDEQ